MSTAVIEAERAERKLRMLKAQVRVLQRADTLQRKVLAKVVDFERQLRENPTEAAKRLPSLFRMADEALGTCASSLISVVEADED